MRWALPQPSSERVNTSDLADDPAQVARSSSNRAISVSSDYSRVEGFEDIVESRRGELRRVIRPSGKYSPLAPNTGYN